MDADSRVTRDLRRDWSDLLEKRGVEACAPKPHAPAPDVVLTPERLLRHAHLDSAKCAYAPFAPSRCTAFAV